MKRFTVTLQEDEFGDIVFPIPEEVIEELGWEVGDDLEYTVDGDSFYLKKISD